MHAKYGSIVRVTLVELHVNNPAFFPKLMPFGKHRRNKYFRLIQLFDFSQTASATIDHNLHRKRRGATSKMFAKKTVKKLKAMMKKRWKKLLIRLKKFQEVDEKIHLLFIFEAVVNVHQISQLDHERSSSVYPKGSCKTPR